MHIVTVPVVAPDTLPISLLSKMPECGVVLGIWYLVHEFSLVVTLVSCGMGDFPPGVKWAEREAYNHLREFHY